MNKKGRPNNVGHQPTGFNVILNNGLCIGINTYINDVAKWLARLGTNRKA